MLAWFGFVPLFDALERRLDSGAPASALFRVGYGFGFTFYVIGTYWIARLSDVAITVPWLKYPAWITAAAYLALYPALAAWLSGTLARKAALPLAVVLPFTFLAVEELRASGELGFPWFQAGYTQHRFAPIVQLASLGSVTLVTLWVAVLNVLIWRAMNERSQYRFGQNPNQQNMSSSAPKPIMGMSCAWAGATRLPRKRAPTNPTIPPTACTPSEPA